MTSFFDDKINNFRNKLFSSKFNFAYKDCDAIANLRELYNDFSFRLIQLPIL